MPKIKMFSTLATDDGLSAGPGDVVTVTDDVAERLTADGYATYASEGDRPKTARRAGPRGTAAK